MEIETPKKRIQARERRRRKRARDKPLRPAPVPEFSSPTTSTSTSEIEPDDDSASEFTQTIRELSVTPESSMEINLGDFPPSPNLGSQPLTGEPEPDYPGPDLDPDPDNSPDDSSAFSGSPAGNRQHIDPQIDPTWLANQLAKIKAQSDVSESALNKVLQVVLPNLHEISAMYDTGRIKRTYGSIKRHAQFSLPTLRCSAKVAQLLPDGTRVVSFLENMPKIPRKYLDPRNGKYQLLCQGAYTTLAAIKEHYKNTHPWISQDDRERIYRNTYLGIDGIRETDHGSRTLIAISIMLYGCIFPWKVLNPMLGVPGAKPDLEELLRPLVEEINEDDDVIITRVICDMVERHNVKGMKGHCGHYSCEMCDAPGNGPGGRIDFDYPRSTTKRARTNLRWRTISRRIRNGHHGTKLGIRAYSPLLDLDTPFDIVQDVPGEEFHLLKEGLTKQMITRIFQGTSRASVEIKDKFNQHFLSMKVFSETPRRTRDIAAINKFKGSEFGVLMFSTLPTLFKDCLPDGVEYWRDVKKCLAAYCFLSRLYFYDDDTYYAVKELVDLTKLHKTFYRTFQRCFCTQYNKGVNPNAHLFWHLQQIREHTGPLWQTSTEPWEAYYNRIRRGFRKGTRNVPLQIMTAIYTADSIDHRCRNNFRMRVSTAGRRAGYSDQNVTDQRGNFWQVQKCLADGRFLCARVKTREFFTGVPLGVGSPLPWGKIGVKRIVGIDENYTRTFEFQEFRGKFMTCGEYGSEWLPQWFRDSKIDY